MGFFDSLSDLVLGTNSNAEDAAEGIGINLGNIFLPGGLRGGYSNTTAQGGFGGTPLNESDYRFASQNWQKFHGIQDHGPTGEYAWWDDPGQNTLSPEGKKYIETALKGGGLSSNFSDVDWSTIAAKFGAPGYAAAPGAEGGAGAAGESPLGDLEPARAGFAGIAAGAPVGPNSRGEILNLLREQANPFETKAFQGINQNLFSRGRLGAEDSATGEAYQGFARGLAEADTGRQLAAFGLSDEIQTNELNRRLGAAQGATGLTGLSTLPFEMALKLAMAKSGAAAQQAGALNAAGGDSLLGAFTSLFGGGGPFGGGGRWGPVK